MPIESFTSNCARYVIPFEDTWKLLPIAMNTVFPQKIGDDVLLNEFVSVYVVGAPDICFPDKGGKKLVLSNQSPRVPCKSSNLVMDVSDSPMKS